jgi:group I intron endonuclease
MESNCGIYKITNIINNCYYIGSSINIKRRWKEHVNMLTKNKHNNVLLQNSWNKYSEKSFKFEVIELTNDRNKLIELEQKYLDELIFKPRNEYFNICLVAGNLLGFKHSNETKAKMSESNKGKTHKFEVINQMVKSSLGRSMSDNTKKKLSSKLLGKPSKNKVKVIQLDLSGNLIKIWDSITEAAKYYNIDPSRICAVCKGRRLSTLGFKWEYHGGMVKKSINTDLKNDIINEYKNNLLSTRQLAKLYNISKSTIHYILKRHNNILENI